MDGAPTSVVRGEKTKAWAGHPPKAGQPVEVKSGESISHTGQLKEAGQASVDATGHPLLVVLAHPNPTVSQPTHDDPNLQIVHRPQQ